MEIEQIEIEVTESDRQTYRRLDHLLSSKFPNYSRTFVKGLFESDMISAESMETKVEVKLVLSKMPPAQTLITIEIPPPIPSGVEAENIPLEILYEDEDVIFINKPAGMVAHPAPGHYTGTLVNALLYHCHNLKGIGNELRPGIVHRLDIGTTGVMVAAKGQKAHEQLVLDFSRHNIERRYEALVPTTKEIPPAGTLNAPIGRHPKNRLKMAVVNSGRRAVTHYKTLENFPKLAHLEMKLETGRTHQIRVHLATMLHSPILNDHQYGNPGEQLPRLGPSFLGLLKNYTYPLLHARSLGLHHPITKKYMEFKIPPSPIFQEALRMARER